MEVVEEWHTVALYIKGKNAIIYDPSFNWIPTSEKIPRVSRVPGRAVLVALLEHQNLRNLQLWIGGGGKKNSPGNHASEVSGHNRVGRPSQEYSQVGSQESPKRGIFLAQVVLTPRFLAWKYSWLGANKVATLGKM
jgi:hypothetical protein